MKIITITGEFDAIDFIALTTVLRDIDIRHPERLFTIEVIDPDSSLDEAEATVRDALPETEGRRTSVRAIRAQPPTIRAVRGGNA